MSTASPHHVRMAQMKNNPYVPGRVKTRALNGAIEAVDEDDNILTEKERTGQVLAQAEARIAADEAGRWSTTGLGSEE
jgi:hypothetical protein